MKGFYVLVLLLVQYPMLQFRLSPVNDRFSIASFAVKHMKHFPLNFNTARHQNTLSSVRISRLNTEIA